MLTILDRRFHDKIGRDEYVNFEKWWTYACESRRQLRSRQRHGACRNFSLQMRKFCSSSLTFSKERRGKEFPAAWLTRSTLRCRASRNDERFLRYRVIRSHHSPKTIPLSQIDSCYSLCWQKQYSRKHVNYDHEAINDGGKNFGINHQLLKWWNEWHSSLLAEN